MDSKENNISFNSDKITSQNKDTLYIYFKKDKNSYLFKDFTQPRLDSIIRFRFKMEDKSEIEFVYRKFFDFDLMDSGTSSLNKKINRNNFKKTKKSSFLIRKFLKKNCETKTTELLKSLSSQLSSYKVLIFIYKERGSYYMKQVYLNKNSHQFFHEKI